jgi:hypothetical protein
MGNDPYRACFIHIPKTAGSTVAFGIFPYIFAQDRICPGYSYEFVLNLSRDELNYFHAFHGHFNGYIRNFFGPKFKYITVLRDPLSRALSDYNYIAAKTDHPLHAAVREKSNFHAFVSDRNTFKHNTMTLALGTNLHPTEVIRAARRLGSTSPMDTILNVATFEVPATAEHLQQAIQTLKACEVVGLQERLRDTVSVLCAAFDVRPPEDVPWLNQTSERLSGREHLESCVIEEFRRNNAFDYELYDVAVGLLDDRCRSLAMAPSQPQQSKERAESRIQSTSRAPPFTVG